MKVQWFLRTFDLGPGHPAKPLPINLLGGERPQLFYDYMILSTERMKMALEKPAIHVACAVILNDQGLCQGFFYYDNYKYKAKYYGIPCDPEFMEKEIVSVIRGR